MTIGQQSGGMLGMWSRVFLAVIATLGVIGAVHNCSHAVKKSTYEDKDITKIRICARKDGSLHPGQDFMTGSFAIDDEIYSTKDYIDFITIEDGTGLSYCEIEYNCDLLINTIPTKQFYRLYSDDENRPVNVAFPSSNPDILKVWDDKRMFKLWMYEHDLQKYMPNSLELHKPITYPCILKEALKHGPKSTHLIENEGALLHQIKILEKKEVPYLIEEALTGLYFTVRIDVAVLHTAVLQQTSRSNPILHFTVSECTTV